MTAGRFLLVVLTLWGLAMIVPDVVRVTRPLHSIGLFVDGDGLIADVTEPFPEEAASPAWRSGIRAGDRLDLEAMRCRLGKIDQCSNAIAALGGVAYLLPGRTVTLDVAATEQAPAREVTVVGARAPSNALVRTVNLLCQIAGILVMLGAAWLVWTRPSAMSWGFFLYVNWFNPGQVHAFYAFLEPRPALFLAQAVAMVLAQAIGYAGFLLFVLRVPNNKTEARWQGFERALPAVAIVFAIILGASYGSLFGYPVEKVTRASILMGFVVAIAALAILVVRGRTQTPEDYQRVRWVVWGCLIGLPAFLVAELASTTTIFITKWGNFTPSEDIVGLPYLVNGLLSLFVIGALRRKRVVNVMIPLRRVTILGLMLSVPVLFMHREVERIEEYLHLPDWAWIAMGAAAVFLLSRLHEGAVHLADRYFNRAVEDAEKRLKQALHQATQAIEIDRLLADESFKALKLASAAAFRRDGEAFRRDGNGQGWKPGEATTIAPDAALLAPVMNGKPYAVPDDDADGIALPEGLARPVLAVPAINPARCFAVSFYGPHESGTDLDASERAMLARLGAEAAAMYAELENGALRARVAHLEAELRAAATGPERRDEDNHGDLRA
ncbi:MAG: hypothetical protein AB7G54_02305 [Methyloceanibacter sp.]